MKKTLIIIDTGYIAWKGINLPTANQLNKLLYLSRKIKKHNGKRNFIDDVD